MLTKKLFATFLLAGAAFAAPITYTASLTGAAESPSNSSPATGSTVVMIDLTAHTFKIIADFSGLTAGVTAAHIHCCTAVPGAGTVGVATVTPTFTGFPSGVTSGHYEFEYDMTLTSSFNAAFVTANGGTAASAEAAFASGIAAGRAYLNIHTTAFTGGEIRGFLAAAAEEVPEPGTLGTFGTALALLTYGIRRRR